MSVKDRIKKFSKYEKISVSTFEKSINVSNGYVNSISKSIGIDKINDILEKYPNINIEWLLTGRGSMLKAENEQQGAVNSVTAEMVQNSNITQSNGTNNNAVNDSKDEKIKYLEENIKHLTDKIKLLEKQIELLERLLG